MQAVLNSLSPESAKKRLIAIIEQHIKTLTATLERQRKKVLTFNQSLLEEWTEILQRMLFLKDAKPLQVRSINNPPGKNQLPNVRSLPQPAPLPLHPNSKYLLNIDANACESFEVNQSNKRKITSSQLAFPKGYLRKYCTYNFIDAENAVLIGGSRQNNPNLKSKEVFTIHLPTGLVSKLAELPYGISSHSAVRVKECIYIIGGNRDMNIVTKSCLSFNYITKESEAIPSLNYACASLTAISWQDQFIYKFGGVGNCFGAWDLSPYIERYSLLEKEWQVINPILRVDESLLDHYCLLANSLAIACKDSILILGGFDFDFSGSNKLMEMSISQDQHQITRIGIVEGMEAGGFFQQEPIMVDSHIHAIQTLNSLKEGLQLKIIDLSTQVRYN